MIKGDLEMNRNTRTIPRHQSSVMDYMSTHYSPHHDLNRHGRGFSFKVSFRKLLIPTLCLILLFGFISGTDWDKALGVQNHSQSR